MRMRYAEPFSLEERLEYRSILLSNLTQSMTVILCVPVCCRLSSRSAFSPFAFREAMIDFEIEFEDDKQVEWSETAMALPDIVDELDGDAVQAMKGLWACRPIQQCVSNASKFQLNDSAGYLWVHPLVRRWLVTDSLRRSFDNIDRFVAPNYVPTTDDIIRCRVRTTGTLGLSLAARRCRDSCTLGFWTGIIESKFQVRSRKILCCADCSRKLSTGERSRVARDRRRRAEI